VKVKTKVGEIETPELHEIGPRTRYWAEAMQDLLKTDEIFCVMGAALEEAYKAGGAIALSNMLRGFDARQEIVDVDYEVIPEGDGSKFAEPAGPSEGGGSTEHPVVDGSLPGGPEESPGSEREHEEKLEEGGRS
jgi:hypothetical protein